MRIYRRDEVCSFRFVRETWGAFSNFAPLAVPIAAGPWTFQWSEALYQAAKFGAAPEMQRRIAGARTAGEAARIGRGAAAGLDPCWMSQRVNAMRWALRMKREANAAAIDAALARTGERAIVEVSSRDAWWGAKPARDSYRGHNVLGRLWMELRQQLRDGDPAARSSAWTGRIRVGRLADPPRAWPAPSRGGGPAGIGRSIPTEECRHAPRPVPPPPTGHGPAPDPLRRRAVNAADIAAALGERAEAVCRHYLPHGRRQGRYWIAGDIDGARGRSLFVRLRGPGVPGKWTDAADGSHGDLLDLIRHCSRAPTLRAALDEARAFLALPLAPHRKPAATAPEDPYDATEAARRLWRRCRAVAGSHAERYLRSRGLARCRFAALRYHPALRYREDSTVRRFPSLVAAVTGDDGQLRGVQRTWLDPCRPAKAGVAVPRKALGRIHGLAVRFGTVSPDDGAALVVGEGIETVLSLLTAVPEIRAAAALSAGSLGAFAPPPGTARLVIARDNDEDGALAAERLAHRCARAGISAAVIVPVGNDFNDDLVDFGAPGLRARLAPLFRADEGREERGVGRADPAGGGSP